MKKNEKPRMKLPTTTKDTKNKTLSIGRTSIFTCRYKLAAGKTDKPTIGVNPIAVDVVGMNKNASKKVKSLLVYSYIFFLQWLQ